MAKETTPQSQKPQPQPQKIWPSKKEGQKSGSGRDFNPPKKGGKKK